MTPFLVQSRTNKRSHLELPVRVERLEEDEDDRDVEYEELKKAVNRMNARLLGFTLSSAGAAVAFALNLLLRKG